MYVTYLYTRGVIVRPAPALRPGRAAHLEQPGISDEGRDQRSRGHELRRTEDQPPETANRDREMREAVPRHTRAHGET